MIRACAWCGNVIEGTKGSADQASPVTHGMCPACAATFFSPKGESMASFLDRLGVPVLVVDSDVRVVSANTQACQVLGKPLAAVRDSLGGTAFQCAHADEPGGCGGTVHCRSCTIRRTVRYTFETGKPCVRVRAYPDVECDHQVRTVCLEISTEKVDGYVMLRIDDLRP
jgi:PAS domain-containing protein